MNATNNNKQQKQHQRQRLRLYAPLEQQQQQQQQTGYYDDDDYDEEKELLLLRSFSSVSASTEPKRRRCTVCCFRCLRRCCMFCVLFPLALYSACYSSYRWQTRQHFLRFGNDDGPYPKNMKQLILYHKGFRLDVDKMYQKDPRAPRPTADEPQICFVHVGKTAGSTLSCFLGFLGPHCKEKHTAEEDRPAVPPAPGLLPYSTTSMMHLNENGCQREISDLNYFLFVVRNPLQRIRSWFVYENPWHYNVSTVHNKRDSTNRQRLFIDCFDNLNQLAELGLAPTLLNATVDHFQHVNLYRTCQLRARQTILGRTNVGRHNYYNYGFYYNVTQQMVQQRQQQQNNLQDDTSPEILVIRTEHLAPDWRSIEHGVLHGPANSSVTFDRPDAHRNASPKRPQDLVLSDTARERLCYYLCREIQIYKRLLQRAVNLDGAAVAASMRELARDCPVEAEATACAIEEVEAEEEEDTGDIEEDDEVGEEDDREDDHSEAYNDDDE